MKAARDDTRGTGFRVLLASVEYPDSDVPFCRRHCGAGYYAVELARHLALRNNNIDVVALSERNVSGEVCIGRRRIWTVPSYEAMHSRLRQLLGADTPHDFVLRNDYVPGMSVTSTAVVPNTSRVVQVLHHGFEAYIPGFVEEPERRRLFQLACLSADRVVTVSRWMADTVIGRDFGYKGRIDVVSGGRDVKQEIRLLFIGNLDSELRASQKGLRDLLRAIRYLREIQGRTIGLVLAGPLSDSDGPGRVTLTGLTSIIAEYGLRECVRVEPQYEDIDKLIDWCTMGVQPSLVESFGGTALNFLLRGKPVVATKIGGFEEFVPEEFLVPPGAPEGLAAKIVEVSDRLDTYSLAGELGTLRSELREQYSWRTRADLFDAIFQELRMCPPQREVYSENLEEFKILNTVDPLREHAGL